jgi:transposase
LSRLYRCRRRCHRRGIDYQAGQDKEGRSNKAWLARDGCRIRLVYLPPYAPNLNLIERLWLLLKKTTLWNEHYATFAAFRAAIAGFFDNLGACRDQLASLITDKFRFIDVSKTQVSAA